VRPSETHSDSLAAGAGTFALTRWSVVLAAGRSQTKLARDALEQLCRTYWSPIYAFVRRQGHSPHDAQDLTQEFFARLLEKNYLQDVHPSKGRFRSFLLASLNHFLANEWDKARAQKRGGGQSLISIDGPSAESSYALEPVENVTPKTLFERRWATALLEKVLARLRTEYVSDGKQKVFNHLRSTLTGERQGLPYAQIGERLGMSEAAVKVVVHRLRARYRELLREEIGHTVSGPEEIDDEIRALFAALA